jgi:two-component system cell cycle sensor histidine kinase/response regulator CckA
VAWIFKEPALPIAAAGGLAILAAPMMPGALVQYLGLGTGAALLWLGAARWSRQPAALSAPQLDAAAQHDLSAVLRCTPSGEILAINPAGLSLQGQSSAQPPSAQQPAPNTPLQTAPAFDTRLDSYLARFTAAPDALATRLAARAMAQGAAADDITTPQGGMRVQAQRLSLPQGPQILWRIDRPLASSADTGRAERLSVPMMTVSGQGRVLFANAALRHLLGQRPSTLNDAMGGQTFRTGEEAWLQTPHGPVCVLMAEMSSTPARREIYLVPLPAQRPDATSTDFEQMPVALMIFETGGALRSSNRAARDILGAALRPDSQFHDLFDALGRPVSDWLLDVAEQRLPAGGQVLRVNTGKADQQVFVQVSLRRMVEGARPSVLAVIQDATALKTLEAQFVQSQKMQAIGQLAGGVAHDFNNLLTAISGNCDLLLLRHSADDASYPDLVQIRQNANRAAALVAQLLAFSRKQTLQPEYLDMQDVFSDLTHLLNRLVGEKLRLDLHHGAGIGTIRADRRQLEQVIVNLVVNARDAMPQGGTIRLQTQALHLADNLARDRAVVPAGDYAVIQVIDTGTGIAPDMLQVIFEPFYTTKKSGEGTGLGLSTAYGIVKQSGGFIFVDSVIGQGTTFTLYFPIHNRPADAPADPPAPKPTAMRQGEGVVLLVEDEAPVRAFAARALRLRGYTVLEAACGEDALSLLTDDQMGVDLFVSDVIMPGLDGPSWVREAQTRRPDVPVIFVSGYAEDVMAEHQHRIPNSTFLPKPFSLTDLTLAVQAKLRPQDPSPS